MIVADEPVASLDVSVQAQILQVFQELQHRLGLTAVFISHDISVVSHVSQRIAVMYLGNIVELGPAQSVIQYPVHPYSRALMSAVLRLGRAPDQAPLRLSGDPPSPTALPAGCDFAARCYLEQVPDCQQLQPQLREVSPGHFVACHKASSSV